MKKFFLLTIILLTIHTELTFSQNGSDKSNIDNTGINSNDDLNAEQIIEKYKPALISIWFTQKNYYSYTSGSYTDTAVLNGSGFIYNEEGYIGTNYHVVEGIDSIVIKTSDGLFYNADVILTDEINDFAIVKIINPENLKFPTIEFANSDYVKAGQEVYAIGSPLGYEYTISSGIIAAVRDNEKVSFSHPETYLNADKTFEKVLQITAAISPGNSGGALFNSKGEVIGITTYTFIGYGNLNFAVAINTFKKLVEKEATKDYEKDENLKIKKEESVFATNFRLATDIKYQLTNDWVNGVNSSYSKKDKDIYAIEADTAQNSMILKSENYFRKCIEVKPDTFIVYQEMLDMYVTLEKFQKAEDLYNEIKIKFKSDSLLNLLSSNLATAYSNSKNYDKALTFYQKMLKEDASQYFIYLQIANIYEQMNDNKSAVKEYKKLLKIDSSYTEAYTKLGKLYYTKYKNNDKAKKYLQKAYSKEFLNTGSTPYNIDLLYLLGMIAVDEGRKLDALLAYMDLKGIYSYEAGDLEKKVELYNKIMEMEE